MSGLPPQIGLGSWRLSDGALQKCTPKETSTVKKTTRFKVGQRGERGVNSVAITTIVVQ